MSQEDKTYYVRIKGPFTASHRTRAGVVVSVDDGYTGPLTSDQLAAIKADANLTVSTKEPKGADPSVLAEAQAAADKVTAEAEADATAQVEAAQKQAEAIVADARKEAEKIKADAAKK